jgi:hypothetical protein
MAEMAIPVSGGRWALVDEEDYYKLKGYKWTAREGKNTVYAYCLKKISKMQNVEAGWGPNESYLGTPFMHRVILNAPDGMEVDHINGNGLDNRRANLRLATREQNNANRRPQPASLSGFLGVQKYREKWRAGLSYSGRRIKLGTYDTPEEAAKAYDSRAKELFKEFARLNFPTS